VSRYKANSRNSQLVDLAHCRRLAQEGPFYEASCSVRGPAESCRDPAAVGQFETFAVRHDHYAPHHFRMTAIAPIVAVAFAARFLRGAVRRVSTRWRRCTTNQPQARDYSGFAGGRESMDAMSCNTALVSSALSPRAASAFSRCSRAAAGFPSAFVIEARIRSVVLRS
jgi:hypothetical protein